MDARAGRALLRGRLQVSSMDAVAHVTCMVEEDPSGLYYCAPPYIQQGWQLYREIMTDGDHERLATALRRAPRWFLSYDLCPEIERLCSWASINSVETCYSEAKTRGASKRARRSEVVVVPAVEGKRSRGLGPDGARLAECGPALCRIARLRNAWLLEWKTTSRRRRLHAGLASATRWRRGTAGFGNARLLALKTVHHSVRHGARDRSKG